MRQLGGAPGAGARLQMTNVDLFDFGLDGLKPDEIAYLEGLAPGATGPGAAPALVTGNAETVNLPTPADMITSVELMQYLSSPLAALANWYNQLAGNGLLIIATEHHWPEWVRYQREPGSPERNETPSKHLLEAFSQAGVRFAVTSECDSEKGFRPDDRPDRFRIMVIQRKPGTALRVTRPVTRVWVNPQHFKAAYYDVPAAGAPPVVTVTRTAAASRGPHARAKPARASAAARPHRR
jgi:SAM-dependent methyltransferase